MNRPYHKKTYYALALDPVHIGTGGYRLGRVDNTIAREPGSNLPKVPGSSIAGITRAYTAMGVQSENRTEIGQQDKTIDYEKYMNWKYRRPSYLLGPVENGKAVVKCDKDGKPFIAGEEKKDGKLEYYSCAGKGYDDGEGHCGRPDCPVCVPFGFSKGKSGSSFQGLAQFFDARILFFPVHTMIGPAWITCPQALEAAGIRFPEQAGTTDWSALNSQLHADQDGKSEEFLYTSSPRVKSHLNLGWLYLPKKALTLDDRPIPVPADWAGPEVDETAKRLLDLGVGSQILDQLIVVSDHLFPRLVNDNLEVRTSVAINPATGAGEDGALFTYEAIPRATLLWFEVVYNKPEYFHILEKTKDNEGLVPREIRHGRKEGEGWTWVRDHVEKGLSLVEFMGVGGMGTRGMGRVRVLNKEA